MLVTRFDPIACPSVLVNRCLCLTATVPERVELEKQGAVRTSDHLSVRSKEKEPSDRERAHSVSAGLRGPHCRANTLCATSTESASRRAYVRATPASDVFSRMSCSSCNWRISRRSDSTCRSSSPRSGACGESLWRFMKGRTRTLTTVEKIQAVHYEYMDYLQVVQDGVNPMDPATNRRVISVRLKISSIFSPE